MFARGPAATTRQARGAAPWGGDPEDRAGEAERERVIGVIGGSGFIGTWLVTALREQGLAVRIVDRRPSEAHPELWVGADVRHLDQLRVACAGCAVLYNLAAEHRDDVQPRRLYDEVNVEGARNVARVAAELGVTRLLFTSTVAVYGLRGDEPDESAPPAPFNDYGRTKLLAEEVYRAWAAADPARGLTIVRPTVVFGPGNRGNVYELLRQLARGRAVVIGDGRNRKSMAYVGNVAAFLVHALGFGPGVHLYNYVDKPDLNMNELVELVGRTLTGKAPRPLRVPYLPGLLLGRACDLVAWLTRRRLAVSAVRIQKYAASTRFAADRLAASGFGPRHDLREALVATIRHEFGRRELGPAEASALP